MILNYENHLQRASDTQENNWPDLTLPLKAAQAPLERFRDHWQLGQYVCQRCHCVLFSASDKFDSGTRWPSFRKSFEKAVMTQTDTSSAMLTELFCANCQLYLGHLFDDGRFCGDTHPDGGLRYCILSSALRFEPA